MVDTIQTLDIASLTPVESAELEVQTEPMALTVGLSPASFQAPRPDLNGLRVKLPGQPEIYLIDQGYRRWIPNPTTFNNLFRNWNGIVEEISITSIPRGQNISSGAILARAYGTAPVYLVDQGLKRWITSPAAMDRYNFAWGRIYELPAISLNAIATGANINA
ncbi:hypothetical protein [Leptolyngbya sp. NIES-2104]|uniref:hypothetical protein n=1 Tax=Leptolyngbya sp. NIES-2104 TaxID=1552121 RepID=UPI0006EC657C|nr:hypothetical protein [Leptolyngbya sp. NIES-2104]GAP94186.1 tachylectin-3 precursor [Leptolyngbya sp. NIES-2104]